MSYYSWENGNLPVFHHNVLANSSQQFNIARSKGGHVSQEYFFYLNTVFMVKIVIYETQLTTLLTTLVNNSFHK